MGYLAFIAVLALIYLVYIQPEHGRLAWAWVKSLFGGSGPTAAALVLAIGLACAPIGAQAQSVCITAERVQAVAAANQHTLVELDTQQREAATAAFNNVEPKTDFVFDRIFIAKRGADAALLVFVNGCMEAAMHIDPEMLEKILLGVEA